MKRFINRKKLNSHYEYISYDYDDINDMIEHIV